MGTWQKYIIGAAILLTSLGVIWKKLLKPTLDFYVTAKEMVPLLRHLTEVFGDDPNALSVLNDIAKQFTTDSGSSLKDQINRLEAAAERQEEATQRQEEAAKKAEADAELLKVGVASQKELAEDDRRQLRNLLVELGVLNVTVSDIKRDARNVADDLAAAHKRADEVVDQPHGAAADAASQQTAKEKRES